jgi:hypothetical protein
MSTETSEPQSFLSYLRERSAIVFTVLLAISIASFVENLHMGKDAIAFVVAELSKIDGWADVVQAVAAIFHAALEWWRGVLRDLLSFMPFHVPQWLHDPLWVIFFGIARAWNAVRTFWEALIDFLILVSSLDKKSSQADFDDATSNYGNVDRSARHFSRLAFLIVMPMVILAVTDRALYQPTPNPEWIKMLATYGAILAFFGMLAYVARSVARELAEARDDTIRELQH